MNGLDELPANKIALAKIIARIGIKGRPKPPHAHLKDADKAMANLRALGFRIVPFPPLSSLKKTRKGGRRKAA